MPIGTLGLLGNMLGVKRGNGRKANIPRCATIRVGEGLVRAGYYQNEQRFNGVYSRNPLPKKDGAYVINFDEYKSIGTQRIALYVNSSNVTSFDSFAFEHIPKDIQKFFSNKNITANIYRIQAYDSIRGQFFCIGYIDFMFKGKSLTQTLLFILLNDFKSK